MRPASPPPAWVNIIHIHLEYYNYHFYQALIFNTFSYFNKLFKNLCAQSFYQTTTLFPPSWSIFTHEHTTHPPSGKIHDKCFRYFGWIQNESDGDFIEILRLIFPGSDCQTLHLSIFNMKISDTCSFYKLYKYFTMKFIKKVQASGFQQFGLKTPMSLENVTKNVTYN